VAVRIHRVSQQRGDRLVRPGARQMPEALGSLHGAEIVGAAGTSAELSEGWSRVTSAFGTFRTCRCPLTMSASIGRPDISHDAQLPKVTQLRVRQEAGKE